MKEDEHSGWLKVENYLACSGISRANIDDAQRKWMGGMDGGGEVEFWSKHRW